MNSDARLILVGKLDIKGMDIVKRVYSPEGICPTLTDMQGGAGNSIVVDVLEHLFKGLEGIIDMRFYTDNPVRDAERYHEHLEDSGKKIGVCEHCSDPIYEGEDYYDIHGDMVHKGCLREWVDEQYKVS